MSSLASARLIPEELEDALVIDRDRIYAATSRRGDPRLLEVLWLLSLGQRTVHWVEFEELMDRRRQASGGDAAVDHARAVREARELFTQVAKIRASDLHLRLNHRQTDILIRFHGELRPFHQTTRYEGERLMRVIYGTMSDVASPTYSPLEPQDARIAERDYLPPGVHSLRVATGPTVSGAQMVVRFFYDDVLDIPMDLPVPAVIQKLGYEGQHAELLLEALDRPAGMLIVAGPTGSGKSTTLKYLLEALHQKRPGLNIQSLEDPPEYPIRGVVQMPVSGEGERKRSKQVHAYLRHTLRVDPDVVMIGEIRDSATAALAVEASLTGHQVWTTIHANDADAVAIRLAGKLVGTSWEHERELLADSRILHTIVYQRLIAELCPACRYVRPLCEAVTLPALTRQRLTEAGIPPDHAVSLRRVEGCDQCRGLGIARLMVIAEVRRGACAPNAGFQGADLRRQALALVRAGRVDPLDAERTVGPLHPSHSGGVVL